MKGASSISPLGIRMPEELKAKIQESATKNGRSVNSEVVSLLELALNSVGTSEREDNQAKEVIEELNKTVQQLVNIMAVQNESIELYKEQVMLIKAFVKKETGYDIQKYLDERVNYDELGKGHLKEPN